jgi:hypothetical protein
MYVNNIGFYIMMNVVIFCSLRDTWVNIEYQWNDRDREKLYDSDKTLPLSHISNTNLTWTAVGAWDTSEHGVSVEWYRQVETEWLGRKTCPSATCPTQNR